jgi:hypothetical protein|tara:strand:+ start:117 stop:278 length:162 start_codon:yes stop_codon:yes gene_type:complete
VVDTSYHTRSIEYKQMAKGDEASARYTRSDRRTAATAAAQQPATPAKEAEKKD